MRKLLKRVFTAVIILLLFLGTNPRFIFAVDTSRDSFLNNSIQNNLISDALFTDINSMSKDDIQNFLNSKNSPLKDYSEDGRSASQIIYDAAHGENEAAGNWGGITINNSTGTISPRVILTYLEKEQSLISRSDLPDNPRTKAMGYQCYSGVSNDNNGNGCNDRYEGFAKQVENGAWQLRYNFEYAKRGAKPTGYATHYLVDEKDDMPKEERYCNAVGDNDCSSINVTMTNASTASIYSYTPYVFWSAYNFWKIFNDWFSDSPAPAPAPAPESSNDTGKLTLKTYTETVTVAGSKKAESKVYFGGQLISESGSSWSITFPAELGTKEYTVEYKDSTGNIVDTKKLEIARHKIGDINGDSLVNIQDLSILSNYWGQDHPGESLANLNPGEDEVVDILDLSILASSWNE